MDQLALWSGLLGGLALFLLGLDILTRALKILAGERMRTVLERLTRNRFLAVLTGALVTAVINSSSVTTVLLVGFVSAGLITMAQSVGVVMGANIGSTFTAQILAFNIGTLALPMIAAGFALSLLGRRDRARESGRAALGLGLVFYGMEVMGQALAPLRDWPPFLTLMTQLAAPALALPVGALFTALVQSSAATMGIVIILAGQSVIDLPTAIALALGANIGTCVTAGLAVLGKSREAVRVFLVHLLFNLLGALLWLPLIDRLAAFVDWLSPGGVDALPRDIANAHTIFNLVNTLLLIGFTPQIARLVAWLVPDRPGATTDLLAPRFLDPGLLATPALALGAARAEIIRLGEQVAAMVEAATPALLAAERSALAVLHDQQDRVRTLNAAILDYLGRLGPAGLGQGEAAILTRLLQTSQHLMAAAEIVGASMTRIGQRAAEAGRSFPPDIHGRLEAIGQVAAGDLRRTLMAVAGPDLAAARAVRDGKHELHRLAREFTADAFKRISAMGPGQTGLFTAAMEVLDQLTRIHRLCRKIAKLELDAAAAQPAAA
jgi:phosphate:Na+ symporter